MTNRYYVVDPDNKFQFSLKEGKAQANDLIKNDFNWDLEFSLEEAKAISTGLKNVIIAEDHQVLGLLKLFGKNFRYVWGFVGKSISYG